MGHYTGHPSKMLIGALSGLAAAAAVVSAGESSERLVPENRGLPPDRVSIRVDSPHFHSRSVTSRIEVWLDGYRRPNDVSEYCVSEGWLRTTDGRRMQGVVEARWRARAPEPHLHPPAEHIDYAARAAAKAARRAERNRKLSGARTR